MTGEGPNESVANSADKGKEHDAGHNDGGDVQVFPADITDITAFSTVSDENFIGTFIVKLNLVFQYSKSHVTNLLETRDIAVLNPLRSELTEKAVTIFDELKDRTLCNRKARNTYANDIFLLGYSIVNNAVASDIIDKVLIKKKIQNVAHVSAPDTESSEEDPSTLPELIRCVVNLRVTISKLQNEVKEANNKYDMLLASINRREDEVTPSTTACEVGAPAASGGNSASGDTSDDGSNQPVIIISSESSSSSSESESDADGYQYQRKEERRRRKKKKKSKTAGRSSAVEPPITLMAANKKSTATDSNKTGVKKDLYIGNVDVDSSEQSVCTHLQTHNIKISPSDVRKLSQTKDSKSFKVSLPEEHFEKAVSSERPIWPGGVKYRPFYDKPGSKGSPNRPRSTRLRGAPGANRSKHPQRSNARSGRPDRPANRRSQYTNFANRRSQYADDHHQWSAWADDETEWPRLPQRPQYRDHEWQVPDHRHHNGGWYYDDQHGY